MGTSGEKRGHHAATNALCVSGQVGPRTLDKSLVLFALRSSGDAAVPRTLDWCPSLITVPTGPVILLDGPASQVMAVHRMVQTNPMVGCMRWEGPLRSLGSTAGNHRVMFRGYLGEGVSKLAISLAVSGMLGREDLQDFVIGGQALLRILPHSLWKSPRLQSSARFGI